MVVINLSYSIGLVELQWAYLQF